MNILHLSPYVPSLKTYHAGGVVMGKDVEFLSKKNNVFVVGFINDEKERALTESYPYEHRFFESSSADKARLIMKNPSLPALFAIRSDKKILEELKKIIREKKIDAVHAEYTAMGYYEVLKEDFPNLIFNLTEHDVVQQSYLRYVHDASGIKKVMLNSQLNKVVSNERKYLEKADHILVLNDKDKNLVQKYYGLGEKTDIFNPYFGVDEDDRAVEKEENSICFVGQMARQENVSAAKRLIRIVKEIRGKIPVTLYIIGANPPDDIKAEENDFIHVTGFVDDINLAIKKCEIAVFPLMEGAGIKIKVLQALGLNLPVVTTHVGAEGIDPEGKNGLILAETDDEIKKEIIALLSDKKYYDEKLSLSEKLMKEKFSMERTVQLFNELYNS